MDTLSICPIGTCRIHQPLRIGAQRYPITFEHGRNYGYVHTSAEALQLLRFMNGDGKIPDDIRPLIFRPSTSDEFTSSLHTPADLYLVEISASKSYTVDGYPVQCNYTYRYFNDFFADSERAKLFWSMARDDQIQERRLLLATIQEFQRLPSSDRELLARIQRRDMIDDEIRRDMEEIVRLVGRNKLVFVTHVNACTPDNAVIERRNVLIKLVRETAKSLGVPCYDPTPLMRRLGQINAVANDGLDLAHYTDLFNERLCEDWYKTFVSPRLNTSSQDDLGPRDEGQLPEIEALWNTGQHLDASRKLHEALRRQPDLCRHRILLGRMQYELGDYENAIQNLQSARKLTGENNEKDNLMLMRAYFGTGRYSEARACAQALLSDEIVTFEIMRVCAVSATQLADHATALGEWKQLFYQSEDKVEPAQAVLSLLEAAGDPKAILDWAKEVLAVLPTHGPCFAVIWNQRIMQADRSALLEMAVRPASLSEQDAFNLVRHAVQQGFAVPAALLASAHKLAESRYPEIAAWVKQQGSDWLQQGMKELEDEKLLEAADKIQARAHLLPVNNTLRRARRTLEQKMRVDIRRAFQEKHYEEVMRVATIAHQTLTRFPELDSFTGRAAYALGDMATALLNLRRAASEEDATIVAKILLARTAARSGEYIEEAIDTYKEILHTEPVEAWVTAEAERQIAKLEGRLPRVARDMLAKGEYDRAWGLLERADKIGAENPTVSREKNRIISTLYSKIKSLDPDNTTERLALGEMILRFSPNNEVGLKTAATAAMRAHRFTEALHYWSLLRHQSEKPEVAETNIKKCQLWIDRAQRKKQSEMLGPTVALLSPVESPCATVTANE